LNPLKRSRTFLSHVLFVVLSSIMLAFLLASPGLSGEAMAQSRSDGNQLAHLFAHPDFILKSAHGRPGPDVPGFSPQQLRTAYTLAGLYNGCGATCVTVAIIDACGNTHAQADLNAYDAYFGLLATTITVVTPQGPPCSDPNGWGIETDLDIEMVHAFAPMAKIVLEEAATNSYADLLGAAQDAYTNQGAKVVTMSWGGSEFSTETGAAADGILSAGNSMGVSFTASSGNNGCGTQYPAASPYVTAVGGTHLTTQPNGTYISETAWNGSGGGVSTYENLPLYQSTYGLTYARRAMPDVAIVADPSTGVAMYDSDLGGWIVIGGTSVGAPLWAGILARVDHRRLVLSQPLLKNADNHLYPVPGADYHDITVGSSGVGCTAGPGYDLVTGLGTPKGSFLMPAIA